MRTNLILFILPLFFILALSCGKSDRKDIEQVLTERETAFETKNVKTYLSTLPGNQNEIKDGKTPSTGEPFNIDEMKKKFEENVSLFDEIDISYSDRSIYMKNGEADVAQKAKIKVTIDATKSTFKLNEQLTLREIDGEWKIVKESEADFMRGFVYGM